ncbi:C-5 cytosine-specific DNA methylase superfamily protein [Besnoitia besnoiti]|uniref:tRNA (cytosine(38)-C(5))-methyltransferase n=1 Tax=Besnoitia besnoiti TaxID=94643 RepID=A0A2A9MJR4_BESBE|nr:C-5 cytosine-specific DNA methylase superfamily protein [Besnoitia besnoiti]PFH36491.1 C-5 cytosine-specific DNA methylase superfamily protein [Besnoitia besnoiti]
MTLRTLILYSGIGGMHCGLLHARHLRRLRLRGIAPFPPLASSSGKQTDEGTLDPETHTGREPPEGGSALNEASGSLSACAVELNEAGAKKADARSAQVSETRYGKDEAGIPPVANVAAEEGAAPLAPEDEDDARLIEALQGVSSDGDDVCIHPIISAHIRLPPIEAFGLPYPVVPCRFSSSPSSCASSSALEPSQPQSVGAVVSPCAAAGAEEDKCGERGEGETGDAGSSAPTSVSLYSADTPEERPVDDESDQDQRRDNDEEAASVEGAEGRSSATGEGKTDTEELSRDTGATQSTTAPSPSGELSASREPSSPSSSPAAVGSSSADGGKAADSDPAAVPADSPPQATPAPLAKPSELDADAVASLRPPSSSSLWCAPCPRLPVEVVGAIDVNPTAMEVYCRNFLPAALSPPASAGPSRHSRHAALPAAASRRTLVSTKSIDAYPASFYGDFKADLWLVSPPCQPFTRAGLQKGNADRRNSSFLYLLDVLCRLPRAARPKYLLLENVVRFEVSDTFECLLHALECVCGYSLTVFHLNPLHFGIPNCRSRCFVAARKGAGPARLASKFPLSQLALAWAGRPTEKRALASATATGGRDGKRQSKSGLRVAEAESDSERAAAKAKRECASPRSRVSRAPQTATGNSVWKLLRPKRRKKAEETTGETEATGEGAEEGQPEPLVVRDARTPAMEGGGGGEGPQSNSRVSSAAPATAGDGGRERREHERGASAPKDVDNMDSTAGPSCLDCDTCERCVRRRRKENAGKLKRVVLNHIPGVYSTSAFFCCPIRPLEDFLDVRFPPKAPYFPLETPPASRPAPPAKHTSETARRSVAGESEGADSRGVSGEDDWEEISLAREASMPRRPYVPSHPGVHRPGCVDTANGVRFSAEADRRWRRQVAALVLSQQQKDRIWFNVDLVRRDDKRSSCFTRSYGRTGHAQYGSLLVIDDDIALERRWAAFAEKERDACRGRKVPQLCAGETAPAATRGEENGSGEEETGRCGLQRDVRGKQSPGAPRLLTRFLFKEAKQSGADRGTAPQGEDSQEAGEDAESKPAGSSRREGAAEEGDRPAPAAKDVETAGRSEDAGRLRKAKKGSEAACEGTSSLRKNDALSPPKLGVLDRGSERCSGPLAKRKSKGALSWFGHTASLLLPSLPPSSLSSPAAAALKKTLNKGWELHDILPSDTAVRFFSPQEMLALHGFPQSFAFPEADEPRAWSAQRRMVGNSLNVFLVGMLIDFLVDDADWQ